MHSKVARKWQSRVLHPATCLSHHPWDLIPLPKPDPASAIYILGCKRVGGYDGASERHLTVEKQQRKGMAMGAKKEKLSRTGQIINLLLLNKGTFCEQIVL